MGSPETETMFLSAGRASADDLAQQTRSIHDTPPLRLLLDAIPEIVAILNEDRQIIFANQALANYLRLGDLAVLYGLRVGNAFNCVHAFETNGGCGTTEFCTQCGVANATHTAQTKGADIRECHIARRDGSAFEFRVMATPLTLGLERYIVFCLTDISMENRQRTIERIFFHDVLNTATGLKGAAELIGEAAPDKQPELAAMVQRLSIRLVSEIQAQRDLAAAEVDELLPRKESCDAVEIVKEIAGLYRTHKVARERLIEVNVPDGLVELKTDPVLLIRVLGNMLKNALEASLPGQTVQIGCEVDPDAVRFRVWNPGVMPRNIQLQVFQRCFSTKDPGRGLGTYSMKLLGEKYLGGVVSFSSVEGEGTTFQIRMPR